MHEQVKLMIVQVRAVYEPRLSHLVDVAVFPSRGSFPLAGKLQGGDYDGDTVCHALISLLRS